MLSSRQAVVTKYGPGVVIHVSDVSSNVYVRINDRADIIFVFDRKDVSPSCSIIANESNESKVDSGALAGNSQCV